MDENYVFIQLYFIQLMLFSIGRYIGEECMEELSEIFMIQAEDFEGKDVKDIKDKIRNLPMFNSENGID